MEPKNIFFIPNQLEGFLSLSQKFEKTMNENSQKFYKDKKEALKWKHQKLIKEDNLINCWFHFKHAFFTEIIKDQIKAG